MTGFNYGSRNLRAIYSICGTTFEAAVICGTTFEAAVTDSVPGLLLCRCLVTAWGSLPRRRRDRRTHHHQIVRVFGPYLFVGSYRPPQAGCCSRQFLPRTR